MSNKFKVGDKVRIIKNTSSLRGYDKYIGQVSIISSIDGSHYPYNLKDINCSCNDEELELVSNFTKADLKEGDIVTLRNGERLFVGEDNRFTDVSNDYNNALCDFDGISDDLIRTYDNNQEDIVKVERPVNYTTVYEREENAKEMTLKEVCDALGYEVKIVKEDN